MKNHQKILLVATLLGTFFLTTFAEASRVNAFKSLVISIKMKSVTGQQITGAWYSGVI